MSVHLIGQPNKRSLLVMLSTLPDSQSDDRSCFEIKPVLCIFFSFPDKENVFDLKFPTDVDKSDGIGL